MAETGELVTLLRDRRRNTTLGWILVVFVLVVVIESALSGDFAWAGFAASVFLLAIVPPIAFRDPTVMLPWEVLFLAAGPLLGRALATNILANQMGTYLSVAALALIVAVELDVFTPVRMTNWFAVLFVALATMAAAGTWAVVRWSADVLLGTSFLLRPGVPEAVIEEEVMWEFVYSTAAGILAGGIFEVYFRRIARGVERLPEEIQEEIG
jgi:hypothetical protein